MSATAPVAVGDKDILVPHRRVRPWGRWSLMAWAIGAALLACIPLAYLVVRVADANPSVVWSVVSRPRTWELMLNTTVLVLSVAAASLVLGVAVAWVLERTDIAGRRVWLVVSALPLAVPSYVAAFGWLALTPVRGFWGSFIVLTLCNVPLVILPTIAALRMATSSHEDVARTLGRSAMRAFMEATWPQIRPAALAGTLLVALYVLSDFGTVALMRYQALTWAVHTAYASQFDRTLAAVLSLMLAALGILLVLAERRARGRFASMGTMVTARAPVVPYRLGRGAFGAHAALAAIAGLALAVPLVALARFLTTTTASTTTVRSSAVVFDALATLGLAAAGAGVALALALPIGLVSARLASRWARATESVSYIGLALPGIVVGLSLVFFSLAVVPALYQTVWILAFAYGVLFLPKAVGAVRSSIGQVEPGVEDVARTLGVSARMVWWRVTARVAWPGIGAGLLLVALTAMKELPATLLLRPTGVDTLATSLWRYTDSAAYAAAAPYALALILVAVVPALLLTREAMRGGGSRNG